jgi:hypothetical protein
VCVQKYYVINPSIVEGVYLGTQYVEFPCKVWANPGCTIQHMFSCVGECVCVCVSACVLCERKHTLIACKWQLGRREAMRGIHSELKPQIWADHLDINKEIWCKHIYDS